MPDVPVSVVLRASDAILEHATGAYLRSSSRVRVLSAQELADADVSVLLLDTVDDNWIRVMRQDAARTSGTPVPVVLIADRITERQLSLAVEYGLTSFLYRGDIDLDRLVDAVVAAGAGRCRLPDDLVAHLIAELGAQQRRQTLTDLARRDGLLVREIEVLRMLSEGMNTVEIADKMSYSERTIKGIIHEAVKRLRVRNRTQAVAYAIRTGIL
ncbi:helix-turn-helix transcriptional regulator [Streptomyces arenae]|uniref:helix-turn-helix transcriptional regulator n=1 Tax=Streptomyces arenae TaxID=29301 RepID=UPI0026592D04|nr:response regulator transcription factor [Streptomyces arenae]MCG7209493.1 response regulator transcription factor [Streptomyces arenae]